jgi:hypothetical protein
MKIDDEGNFNVNFSPYLKGLLKARKENSERGELWAKWRQR